MALQGQYIQDGCKMDFTPVAACLDGDVVLLPGGTAGICIGNIAAEQIGAVQVSGIVKLEKTTSMVLLVGGDAYWDVSASKVSYKADAGTNDFFIGRVTADATSSDTTCYVELNKRSRHIIDLHGADQEWTNAITGAATLAVYPGNIVRANLINTSEAECVTVMSKRTVLPTHKPILEARLSRIAASSNAVDIDVGLASGVSTSDFDAVAAFVAVHLDGGDNDIDTQSDDGVTDRALADSTINDTDATFFEVWIDCRDTANCLVYINGVLVDTSSLKLVLTDALTTPLAAVISIEKTSGTATAELQVSRLRVRHQAE